LEASFKLLSAEMMLPFFGYLRKCLDVYLGSMAFEWVFLMMADLDLLTPSDG
jgi:hypothetical protein